MAQNFLTIDWNKVYGTVQRGTGQAAQAVANPPSNSFLGQARAAGQALAQPIRQGLQTIGAPVFNQQLNKQVTNAMMNPVQTFGTPALQKAGVPGGVATAVGALGDAFNPLGGSEGDIARLAAKVPHIHPQDVAVMSKFIDAVASKSPLLAGELGNSAEKLAQFWQINLDKGIGHIASEFKNILSGKTAVRGTVLQPRDAMQRFMPFK